MNAVFEQLQQLLDAREVRYTPDESNHLVRADLRCEVGTVRVVAQVDVAAELFQVFGFSPLRVPEGCRSDILEAVARANFGLRLGKFEFDVDDGEIRFHIGQVLTHEELTDELLDRMIFTTLGMIDLYLPAFLSVIYGNELPRDAIAFAEAGSRSSSQDEDDEEESLEPERDRECEEESDLDFDGDEDD